jgi:Xaa-Pro aminopeptidase
MLSPSQLGGIRRAIADAGADGWLLYDFHGINPIAAGVAGISGMVSRRYFCYIPREGNPVAITHAIEQGPWEQWPAEWPKHVYSSWRDFEKYLGDTVRGKRVAMEYSPGDAVPYLDRVPAGVVELVRNSGAEVVTSADLVTRIYAVWTPDQLEAHKRAAEHLARIARNAMALAGEKARSGKPIREYELSMLIREEFAQANLVTDNHGPNVSIGLNAANPHYDPTAEKSSLINDGDIILIDLWAREPGAPFADQTWMGSLGPVSSENAVIWETVRGARDAAIEVLRDAVESGRPVTGGEADDAARNYITKRGFGKHFTHRTGHSIDSRDIHGSGPNIDNLETRDVRMLLPGVAFSIEPGIYIPGQVGMRTEVNGFIQEGSLLITPERIQQDVFIV